MKLSGKIPNHELINQDFTRDVLDECRKNQRAILLIVTSDKDGGYKIEANFNFGQVSDQVLLDVLKKCVTIIEKEIHGRESQV